MDQILKQLEMLNALGAADQDENNPLDDEDMDFDELLKLGMSLGQTPADAAHPLPGQDAVSPLTGVGAVIIFENRPSAAALTTFFGALGSYQKEMANVYSFSCPSAQAAYDLACGCFAHEAFILCSGSFFRHAEGRFAALEAKEETAGAPSDEGTEH